MTYMYNLPATQANWVSPLLCLQLEKFLQVKTAFLWKIEGTKCELQSSIFDPDHYYSNVDSMLLEVKIINIVRAFTIGEMEAMLPDYFVSRSNGNYRISCSSIKELQAVESSRLADAMAEMVIECLNKKVIDLLTIEKKYSV